MTISDSQVAADWELAKLVHELDMQSSARQRERVGKLGLTIGQASALRELTGPMTLKELAVHMGCEPSNAIVVIDQLESQHLVERRPHPTDRRAKQLMLTPGGDQRRNELLASLRGEEPLMTGLTQQEQDALQDLLRRAISRH
ncbi:MarR family winged helix-turn-helix transcriptional regulator [Kutzneria sp. CA-103260]|uniref:MarR family winged helix-turn-helix transcriptional regulator n=1 Tax=Kutzneria sp. CA-103260 TaxID=2802641 RepID=UPI001BEDEA7E|nr:MarR family transcriptional regulator [Kutzneria sp. CA-103260]QUQ64627.1 Transcriptional regulator SlyA [Kutzneria sp. CA-103260]